MSADRGDVSSDLRFSTKEEIGSFISTARIHFGNNIAGIDEVARGALCGPLVVGCVVLPSDHGIKGIKDSKRLSPRRREDLAEQIHAAGKCGLGVCEAAEVDELGPRGAVSKAGLDALFSCAQKININFVLCDGTIQLDTDKPYYSIIDGDKWVECISAASIIAKVYHDKQMAVYDEIWPEYGWNKNSGYSTEAHIEAIYKYGITQLHRKTFGVCREAIVRE